MAAIAMVPTQVTSMNAIYNWRLFVDHYQLDARDTRVDWLYSTFGYLFRAYILLSEGL